MKFGFNDFFFFLSFVLFRVQNHTLVQLHPLPGPAHRRQVEVRPPPPNSQRKGSRCDRCPCEDHAQLWRAQKQPTKAVCSRRRLHTPVRSPCLVHSSTNASLHTTGGVSPPTSLPACDRRPAACRLRGHICPCRHTTAGPSRRRASAALWPPPRRRKGRGTLGNAKQVAGSMGPIEEGPMDAPTDSKYQSVDREEARRAELPPQLPGMASSNTIADATTTIKALNARSAPHPSRMRSTCFITARGSAKKERDYTPCSTSTKTYTNCKITAVNLKNSFVKSCILGQTRFYPTVRHQINVQFNSIQRREILFTDSTCDKGVCRIDMSDSSSVLL
ncbi:unnamed protein product [Trichogramma brassicae]|uniref:Uncharacterized protein n=1 Tax=Trichogramma brassicae TaxID=86971 RepID=A0A6H5ILF0_9HYME|nr:unnamed protein product [Trichogramma brassicae]